MPAARHLFQNRRHLIAVIQTVMNSYITVNTAAEWVCFLVSLLCLYKDKEPAWRLLVLFLLVTCLVELGGIYIRNELHRSNAWIYNIYLVTECGVESYFFYYLYKAYHNRRKLLVIWLVVFLLCYLAELISNSFAGYAFKTSVLLSVVLILASVYYYYLVLKEEQYRQLSTDAPFWWVNGTICFYFAGIASNIFFSYLVRDKTPGINHSARYIVFCILNVILYSGWSYSFICRYRQRNSSSSSL